MATPVIQIDNTIINLSKFETIKLEAAKVTFCSESRTKSFLFKNTEEAKLCFSAIKSTLHSGNDAFGVNYGMLLFFTKKSTFL